MTLKEHIDDIGKRLEQIFFKSETAVRQGIVDPLLRSLGWPTDNTLIVFPEYPIGSGHVDYALCQPSSTPRVFIEAKQVGNIKGAEEQLFGYDSYIRVPIAVLTDGREWQFFHPTGEGTWAERKVCELDLITGNSKENAEELKRYLNYESTRARKTVEAIEDDYEKIVQQRHVATRLPEAWDKLVAEADEFLLHIIAEKTDSLCEHRPTDEQVLDFLKSLERKVELNLEADVFPSIPSMLSTSSHSPRKQRKPAKGLRVTMPSGKVIEHSKATDTWIEVILQLGLDQVMAEDIEELLVSTTPKFRQYFRHSQYYIATDYGTIVKKKRLDRIADRLGVQLKVEIVDKQRSLT